MNSQRFLQDFPAQLDQYLDLSAEVAAKNLQDLMERPDQSCSFRPVTLRRTDGELEPVSGMIFDAGTLWLESDSRGVIDASLYTSAEELRRAMTASSMPGVAERCREADFALQKLIGKLQSSLAETCPQGHEIAGRVLTRLVSGELHMERIFIEEAALQLAGTINGREVKIRLIDLVQPVAALEALAQTVVNQQVEHNHEPGPLQISTQELALRLGQSLGSGLVAADRLLELVTALREEALMRSPDEHAAHLEDQERQLQGPSLG